MVDIVRTLFGLDEQKAEPKKRKVKRKVKKKVDPAPKRRGPTYRKPVRRAKKPEPEPEAEEVEPDDLDAE